MQSRLNYLLKSRKEKGAYGMSVLKFRKPLGKKTTSEKI